MYTCRKCSPSYMSYVSSAAATRGKLKICGAFSRRIYSVCKNDELNINGTCVNIGSMYTAETLINEGFSEDFVMYSTDNKCFNTSSFTSYSASLLMLLSFLLYIVI
jgi:hypothetical protein